MKSRHLPRLSRRDVALLILLLVIGVILFGEFHGPIDPYHRAALGALQAALAELPPYPDSEAGQPATKAGPLEYPTVLQVLYGTDAACADVQAYYASTAAAVSWRVRQPVYTIHRDSNADHDELDSSQIKKENGFELELIIACFADPSYQPGYTLSLQTPPEPSL
ncbi:MAG TPA: hypothetical protein VIC85_06555 [Ktedonobacterales bacterium]